jgi:O-antigen ligase
VLSFGVLCLVVLFAPRALSGFLPGNYLDQFTLPSLFGPLTALSLLATITACVCLLMALRPGNSVESGDAVAPSTRMRNLMKRFPVAAWLGAFFVWCVLASLTTVYRHDTLLELTRVGCCVVLFLVAVALLRDNVDALDEEKSRIVVTRQMALLLCITVGTLLVSTPALLQFLRGASGLFGSFSNPNFFANYGVMAVPLALAWTVQNARAKSGSSQHWLFVGAGAVATLVLVGGVISTNSKGGFLSLLVGLIVFAVAAVRAQGAAIREWVAAHRVLVAVGLVLLLAVGSVVTARTVGPRLLAARDGDNNSTMFRAYTWQSTAHMALARPLLGWGPGSFPSAYGQFAITGTTRHAHQVWLQIAAENGIVASLLLLGACLAATARGWHALRGMNWPLAAGALAALWAFIAHGFTDYGWATTSIALLFLLVLALLQTVPTTSSNTSAEEPYESPQFALRWPWLGLTLLVALSAWWMQRVVGGADYMNRANDMWSSGSPTMALQFARDAVSSDPLSARWHTQLGSMLESTDADADAAFERATLLQPTNGQLWRRWAEYRAEHATSTQRSGPSTETLFNRAVQLDRNSTSIRLARAQWLQGQNDPRAWNDLQYIMQLRDAPYGRYRALADLVNLDFARASIPLTRRALQSDNKTGAQQLITRSLNEVKEARGKEEYWRQINSAGGGAGEFGDARDLGDIEAQLNALKEQLK